MFAQGLKFKADFHSKMSVCRHELRGGGFNRNPQTILTLYYFIDVSNARLRTEIYEDVKKLIC